MRTETFASGLPPEVIVPETVTAAAAWLKLLTRRRFDGHPLAEADASDVAQQAIELLSQDLDRFQRLVEDLLEISRMEAGAVQLQLSQFKLEEFLENVLTQSRHPHLLLGLFHDGPDVIITADKRRLPIAAHHASGNESPRRCRARTASACRRCTGCAAPRSIERRPPASRREPPRGWAPGC